MNKTLQTVVSQLGLSPTVIHQRMVYAIFIPVDDESLDVFEMTYRQLRERVSATLHDNGYIAMPPLLPDDSGDVFMLEVSDATGGSILDRLNAMIVVYYERGE